MALEDTIPIERIQTVNQIADLEDAGELGASAVLRLALHDPDAEVRTSSRWALRRFPAARTKMMDALATALSDPDTLVRASAAAALGHVAELSERALPLLLTAAADPSAAVLAGVNEGLGAVLKIWPGQVPGLIDFFTRCDARLRFHAGEALVPAGVVAVPPLLPLLDHPDWNVRANAARALGLIRETDAGVTDALVARLEDRDYRVRQYAIQALGRLGTPRSHDALVLHRGGRETHGPPRKTLTLASHAVKPDTSVVAVAARYRVSREALDRGRLEDVTIAEEHRLYLCDVESRNLRLLGRIDVPSELRSDFSVSVIGWLGDSVAMRLHDRRARNPSGFQYPAESRLVIMDSIGKSRTVPTFPTHPSQSRGYRDSPKGERHFLRINVSHDQIAKFVDDDPGVVVFRVVPETGELLPADP